MMATAASGTKTVWYGAMRETVTAGQCVILADGTVGERPAGTNAMKRKRGRVATTNLVAIWSGGRVMAHLTRQEVTTRARSHKLSAVAVIDRLHDAAITVAFFCWSQTRFFPILRRELLDAAVSVPAYHNDSFATIIRGQAPDDALS
jgi:hypothetical protein